MNTMCGVPDTAGAPQQTTVYADQNFKQYIPGDAMCGVPDPVGAPQQTTVYMRIEFLKGINHATHCAVFPAWPVHHRKTHIGITEMFETINSAVFPTWSVHHIRQLDIKH